MSYDSCNTVTAPQTLCLVTLHTGIILVPHGVSSNTSKTELNKNSVTLHPHTHKKIMQNT